MKHIAKIVLLALVAQSSSVFAATSPNSPFSGASAAAGKGDAEASASHQTPRERGAGLGQIYKAHYDKSATKFQAAWRGHATRNQLAKEKADDQAGVNGWFFGGAKKDINHALWKEREGITGKTFNNPKTTEDWKQVQSAVDKQQPNAVRSKQTWLQRLVRSMSDNRKILGGGGGVLGVSTIMAGLSIGLAKRNKGRKVTEITNPVNRFFTRLGRALGVSAHKTAAAA